MLQAEGKKLFSIKHLGLRQFHDLATKSARNSQKKKRSLGDCHVLLPRWIYILKNRRHIQAAQPNLHLVNKHC
jgi:hypothetical protein